VWRTNYGIPGLLKNAIDWASRPAFDSVFKGKLCLVISVSGGATGGVRAQSHLKYVLNGMLAEVFPCREIVVPFANDKVADGLMTDEEVLGFTEETLRAFISHAGDGSSG
jgi:chromate reductase